ncbi:MAG: hypothetical protein IJ300_00285 [Clostridia bacterium]|nr:hypothetical protein [Clostridia bacterium]
MKKLLITLIAACLFITSSASAQFSSVSIEKSEASSSSFTGGLKLGSFRKINRLPGAAYNSSNEESTLLPFEEYLRKELENHTEAIDIYSYRITLAQLAAMYNQFIMCNSDLPVYTGCGYSLNESYVDVIKPSYIYDTKEESDAKYAEFDKLTDSLAEHASNGKSELEKALFAYDKIVMTYDYTPGDSSEFKSIDYSPYGFLDNGVAVCQAYSILYMLVLDKLGIESYVCANDNTEVNHGWNYVKLDGKWYHSDTTWGEFSNTRNAVNHKYFLLSDNEMITDAGHGSKADWAIMSTTTEKPDCTSTDYSNGYLFNKMTSCFTRDESSLVFTEELILSDTTTLYVTFRTSDLTLTDMLISEQNNGYVYVYSLADVSHANIFIAAYTPAGYYKDYNCSKIENLPENTLIPVPLIASTVIPLKATAGDSIKFMILGADFVTPLGNYSEFIN